MVMNNKGQVLFYAFMLGLTVIVLALALAFPVREQIDSVRSASSETNFSYEVSNGTEGSYWINGTITTQGLDCDNSSISMYDKSTCVVTDLGIFYFIGILIFIGGAIITSKIIFT